MLETFSGTGFSAKNIVASDIQQTSVQKRNLKKIYFSAWEPVLLPVTQPPGILTATFFSLESNHETQWGMEKPCEDTSKPCPGMQGFKVNLSFTLQSKAATVHTL